MIAFGQIYPAGSLLGIRRIQEAAGVPLRAPGGRLLVVPIEAPDSGPLDPGTAAEACEIGGLGHCTCRVGPLPGPASGLRRPGDREAAGGRLFDRETNR